MKYENGKFWHNSLSRGPMFLRGMHTKHIKNYLSLQLKRVMSIGEEIDEYLPYLGELALRGQLNAGLLHTARTMASDTERRLPEHDTRTEGQLVEDAAWEFAPDGGERYNLGRAALLKVQRELESRRRWYHVTKGSEAAGYVEMSDLEMRVQYRARGYTCTKVQFPPWQEGDQYKHSSSVVGR